MIHFVRDFIIRHKIDIVNSEYKKIKKFFLVSKKYNFVLLMIKMLTKSAFFLLFVL